MARVGCAQARLGGGAPSSAPAVPVTTVTSRHSALVRVTHWIIALCFLALLVSGSEILISHPRFYWGETGNVLDDPVVQTADSFLAVAGADRLRVRAAGPEWLEPLSPLSSCLDCGIDRLAVCDFRLCYGALPEKLAARIRPIFRGGRSRLLSLNICASRGPSEAEAWSYNLLQRLAYLFVIFVLFPVGHLDGLGDVSRVRFRVSVRPSLCWAASNRRARFTSSSPWLSYSFCLSTW